MIKTTTNKKRLTPASITAQKAWGKFPISLKRELVKSLSDKDMDGVPNGFDCKPNNRRRQEGFLPDDMAFIKKNPLVDVGKRIGEGTCGAVYGVRGNDNLVLKIPLGFMNDGSRYSARARKISRSVDDIEAEAQLYDKYNLNAEPLFIPTKVIDIGGTDVMDGKYIGLLRPKVKMAGTYKGAHKPTDAQIEELRRKVIHLSHKGYAFNDDLQVGFDKAGRSLLFDVGYVNKNNKSSAFFINNRAWRKFLAGARCLATDSQLNIALKQYGTINSDENY
jgi:hypothetical protein